MRIERHSILPLVCSQSRQLRMISAAIAQNGAGCSQISCLEMGPTVLKHSRNRDHLPDHLRIEVVPQMLRSLIVP